MSNIKLSEDAIPGKKLLKERWKNENQSTKCLNIFSNFFFSCNKKKIEWAKKIPEEAWLPRTAIEKN